MKKSLLFSTLAMTAVLLLSSCNSKPQSVIVDNPNASYVEIIESKTDNDNGKPSTEIQTRDDWRFQYSEDLDGIIIKKCLCANTTRDERIYSEDKDIVVPDSFEGFEGVKVLEIGQNAFANIVCKSLTLPDGLLYIDKNAFEYANIADNLKIPETVTDIGYQAFSHYKGISVEMPPIEKISEQMFVYSEIQSLSISEGTKIITDCAFNCCDQLTDVKMADSVEEISSSAFSECYKLDKFALPNNLRVLDISALPINSALTLPVVTFKGVTYDFPAAKDIDMDTYQGLIDELSAAVEANA